MTANLWWDDPRVTNLLDHAERCEMPLTFHVANREGNIYGLIDDFGLPRLEKQVADHPGMVALAMQEVRPPQVNWPKSEWELIASGAGR